MEIHKPTVIMTSAAQEWKQGSQGYLQAEATVTLSAELPTYFGNLQDLLGFRASKSPPVRLLQMVFDQLILGVGQQLHQNWSWEFAG